MQAFQNWLRGTLGLCMALLSVLPAAAAPSQGPRAALQGVVTAMRSGEPIEGARVFLLDALLNERSFRPVTTAVVLTNSTGQFVFENLNAGSYRIVVTHDGYVKRDSPKVVLSAGQRMKDMVFRLKPTGNISGTVRNVSGKPLAAVEVTLLRPVYNEDGTRGFEGAGTAQTDDRGQYRLHGISPGSYFVMAGGGIGRQSRSPVQDAFDTAVRFGVNIVTENYARAFFPGVTDLSRASTIDLDGGVELREVNFTLSRPQLYSIRGRLIDPTTGKPPAQAWLTLTQRDLTGYGIAEPLDHDATGAFEISGLPPGRYLVSAIASEKFSSDPSPGIPSAEREVVIEGASVDLNLTMAVQPIITGQIRLEGTLPEGKSMNPALRVSLLPTDSLPSLRWWTPYAVPDETGRFDFVAMRDGSYRVTVAGFPEGSYLKDARLDGVDVLNGSARFSASGTLEVVIAANAARVDGRVVDEQMRPVAGIEAILIPDQHRSRVELFKSAVTDHEGRFSFPNITPGDYRVFAWENIEANSYFDENVVRRFQEMGTRVHAAESSRVSVEVRQIPEEAVP